MMRKVFLLLVIPFSLIVLAVACSTSGNGERAEHVGHVSEVDQNESSGEALYHCPMHPTYMSDSPGECPICGMTLVPVEDEEGGESEVEGRAGVKVSPEKQQLIGVTFDTAHVSDLSMKIRTVGRLTYDETKIVKVHTRISGWVEKLHIDYTGKEVKKGEPLFSLYSPQLYSTQEEYLLALEGESLLSASSMPGTSEMAQSLSEATRRRLLLWDITEDQIASLERTGRSEVDLEIVSPIDGFVIEKNAFEGKYVSPGDILYTIADLKKIWAIADVYEYELPYVKVGQEAKITLSYFPGEEFIGRITYVYPYLNNAARTAQVRFEIDNEDLKLKPDMYVNVQLEIDLGPRLLVPSGAILYAGDRYVAYVKKDEKNFEPREIITGVSSDGYVEVLDGIIEGEMVVTSANFLLDSESQLRAAVMSMIGGDHGGH
ncbi:MAG: efflux RND transporter periplasmic adaptor subunit [Candidatus Glassbacteria bacterium]